MVIIMKIFKKVGCLVFAVAMCMSMGVSALAADANPAESQVYISNIYLVEDGIGREISYEEYAALEEQYAQHKESRISNDIVMPLAIKPPEVSPTYVTYDEYINDDSAEYDYYDFDNPIGVSSVLEGPLTVNVSEVESKTISATFSIAVPLTIKNKIVKSATFSGSLGISTTTSKSQSISGTVPAGMYGRICFRPRYNHMEGTLQHWITYETGFSGIVSQEHIESDIPIKVGKFADGIYYLAKAATASALPN